jgi:branched-chain amino acid aminotransferase
MIEGIKNSNVEWRDGSEEFLVYIDGQYVEATEAKVSVFDSGLNFADGVFEGVRVYEGRVFRLDEHLKRLHESARALEIGMPLEASRLRTVILEWLARNRIKDHFHFRPIVTRGIRFPPRLDPRFCTGESSLLLVGGPLEPLSKPGIRVITSSVRRTAADAFDAKVKSLSYGNSLLARLEAIRYGVDDAFMLDAAGFLAEATAANVFILKDGRLSTPLPKACLEGITRGAIMGLAVDLGLSVAERDISPTEFINAEEVFLTGTGAGLTPVVEVDGRPIGRGVPGEVADALRDEYSKLVVSEGVPIEAASAVAQVSAGRATAANDKR